MLEFAIRRGRIWEPLCAPQNIETRGVQEERIVRSRVGCLRSNRRRDSWVCQCHAIPLNGSAVRWGRLLYDV